MESPNAYRRVTITLPQDIAESLATLARDHYRDPRREALHLLTGAVRREVRRVSRAAATTPADEP